jgi:hypothetical protein
MEGLIWGSAVKLPEVNFPERDKISSSGKLDGDPLHVDYWYSREF